MKLLASYTLLYSYVIYPKYMHCSLFTTAKYQINFSINTENSTSYINIELLPYIKTRNLCSSLAKTAQRICRNYEINIAECKWCGIDVEWHLGKKYCSLSKALRRSHPKLYSLQLIGCDL